MTTQSNRHRKIKNSTQIPKNLSVSFHSSQTGDVLVFELLKTWRKFARHSGPAALGMYAVQFYDASPVFYVHAESAEQALANFAYTLARALRVRGESGPSTKGTARQPLYLMSAGPCTDPDCECGGAPTYALRII